MCVGLITTTVAFFTLATVADASISWCARSRAALSCGSPSLSLYSRFTSSFDMRRRFIHARREEHRHDEQDHRPRERRRIRDDRMRVARARDRVLQEIRRRRRERRNRRRRERDRDEERDGLRGLRRDAAVAFFAGLEQPL